MSQANHPRDYANMLADFPFKPRKILIEGDSWVSHPFLANLTAQFDQFGKGEFAILNMAQPGDTAKRMLSPDSSQFKDLSALIVNEQYGYKWDFIFISAAGNDIVGDDILSYVDDKSPGKYGKELINDSFSKRVTQIAEDFKNLIDFRDQSEANPTTPIVTHAYSYLTPRKVGTKLFGAMLGSGWIQRYLEPKGIEDIEEQKEIVREMLDQYYNAMKGLEQPGNNFVVVDTRPLLSRTPTRPNLAWWHDEIHPNYTGFKKVAEVIRTEMKVAGYWP
ncbi:MAG: SGNH/GDSL hydrolase family protein [Gallionellaceae bacterium]|nr:SGNH/GDSL hydrolase family protein [Gallionellaceae bacterium]